MSRFIDMIEQYFGQPEDVKMKDVRKEYYYQVRMSCEAFDTVLS